MTTETTTGRRAPQDLVLRGYRGLPDLEEFVRIFNVSHEREGIDERVSVEGMRNWLEFPDDHFDPARDVVVATIGAEVVGYGWSTWIVTNDGQFREYRFRGNVDPDWRGRGIGSAILAHHEARLREVASGHPDDRPKVFGTWASDRRPDAAALFTENGYEPVRYFFEMVRPSLDEIDVPPMPEGIEVRPSADPSLYRQLFDADVEAFVDHWGGFNASDEAYKQ
jgi:GNAT superfamily N-acetyltransferase